MVEIDSLAIIVVGTSPPARAMRACENKEEWVGVEEEEDRERGFDVAWIGRRDGGMEG
jgi:hypothetical protein